MKFASSLFAAAMLAGSFCTTVAAQATEWPARTITWVVPFSAGGPTDVMAREIAEKIRTRLGQPIVIDNAGGAGGTIGAAKASRAKPDGYTFLVGHMGYMGAAPSLYKKLAYDPLKDFDAVFRFPDTPLVMLVSQNSPFKSAAEVIQAAKERPGKLNFGNAGVGSTSHLVAALFASRAGIDIASIPYKGAAPALNDLIAGQVDVMFDQTNTALPQVSGGRLRALALTSLEPMPQQYPNVPVLADKVLPGFEAATWYGLYAPKGTPADILAKMHKVYIEAMADDAWRKQMSERGIHLLTEAQYGPVAFQKHTADEVEKWRKVAAQANISLD